MEYPTPITPEQRASLDERRQQFDADIQRIRDRKWDDDTASSSMTAGEAVVRIASQGD